MDALEADRSVPALIVKIGHYPVHAGGLAAIRTLGRLGVPAYVTAEDGFTPATVSRYCAGWFRWRTNGSEEPGLLVRRLNAFGDRIGRRSVLVPVDDESATLAAEHAGELAERFLLPAVPPELPRQLASKHRLHLLCRRHGVPTPASGHLAGPEAALAFAGRAAFPVVVKNAEPWVRMQTPVVGGTTLLHRPAELLALAHAHPAGLSLLVQEYIPQEDAEDWIVHLYRGADPASLVLFTGVKVRSWPRHAGQTACAYAVPNPELAQLTERFCQATGFQGVADLDWRFDRRDGQYKLVDFNPRLGNQFRLFVTGAGVDVVRALHLDLTGRGVPAGEQVSGRRILMEHADPLARLAYRGSRYSALSAPDSWTGTELAWAARDDPLPFLAIWPRLAGPLTAQLARAGQGLRRRGAQAGALAPPGYGVLAMDGQRPGAARPQSPAGDVPPAPLGIVTESSR